MDTGPPVGSGDIELFSGPQGLQVADNRPRPVWARVTGTEAGAGELAGLTVHTWAPVLETDAANEFPDDESDFAAPSDGLPAVEVNGATVRPGKVVRLYLSPTQTYYLFSADCCPVKFDAVTNVFMTDGSTAGQGFSIPFTPDAKTFNIAPGGVYYWVPHHCVAETPPAPAQQGVDATKGLYWLTATVRAGVSLNWSLANATYDGVDVALHYCLALLDADEDVAVAFLSPWVKILRFQGRSRLSGSHEVTTGDGWLVPDGGSPFPTGVWENTVTTAVPSAIKLDKDGGERVGVVLRLQVLGPIGAAARQATVSCPYPGVHQTEQSSGYFAPCIRIDPVCCGTSESGPLPTPSGDTIITRRGLAVTAGGDLLKV